MNNSHLDSLYNQISKSSTVFTPASAELGFTFSPAEMDYLNYLFPAVPKAEESLKMLLENLNPDIIRLAIRWNEVEKESNNIDTTLAITMMEIIKDHVKSGGKTKVEFCLGVKSPRYPEYHAPVNINLSKYADKDKNITADIFSHMQNYFNIIIENILRPYSDILYGVNIENEGFDDAGPDGYKISPELYKAEINYLRRNFDQDLFITSTFWGKEAFKRKSLDELIFLANNHYINAIGISHYPITPSWGGYEGMKRSLRNIQSYIKDKTSVPFYISEQMFEPWERNDENNEKKFSDKPESMNYELARYFMNEASQIIPTRIDLWGIEWILQQKFARSNLEMMNLITNIFAGKEY